MPSLWIDTPSLVIYHLTISACVNCGSAVAFDNSDYILYHTVDRDFDVAQRSLKYREWLVTRRTMRMYTRDLEATHSGKTSPCSPLLGLSMPDTFCV